MIKCRLSHADSEMEVFEKCRGKAVFEHEQWFGLIVGEFKATWFTAKFVAEQMRLDPESERAFFEHLDDLHA